MRSFSDVTTPEPTHFNSANTRAVARTIFHVEAISIGAPLLILVAICGIPQLPAGPPPPGLETLKYYLVALAAGRMSIFLSGIIAIYPWRRMRYRRAAQALGDSLRARPDAAGIIHQWHEATPGALGMIRSGKLVLIDHSTRYQPLELDSSRILVTFEKENLGLRALRWLIGDYRIGERAALRPWAARQAILGIRYRGEGFGSLLISRIAFGDNLREAEMLYTNLSRLTRPAG